MTDIAIKVENIGKSYFLGHNNYRSERYTSLRDVIANNVKGLVRKTNDLLKGNPIIQGDEIEEFRALKDINFEIKQGDRVGIIGRNGAGKSTLLKILSRITEPTTGRILINGRVASLLEVGTGFHPELTGRENIFLNGAILGMNRKEILRKFDEIVDFADVEKFLDTPVKRYSSGMYVRLAFSVAAHLEPEILIVDEVLAVGDSRFQEKCMDKMEEAGKDGRTVVFVSHNMGSIRTLCNNGILLKSGGVEDMGPIDQVLNTYFQADQKIGSVSIFESNRQGVAYIKRVRVTDEQDQAAVGFQLGDRFNLELLIDGMTLNKIYHASFIIRSAEGQNIYHIKSEDDSFELKSVSGSELYRISIAPLKLYPGKYIIDDIWLADEDKRTLDLIKDGVGFEILDGGYYVGRKLESKGGLVFEKSCWKKLNTES